MKKNESKCKGLEFLIANIPLARYFEWEIFLNPGAANDCYDTDKQPKLFYAERNGIAMKVEAGSIRGIRKKIDLERKTSKIFRNKCMVRLTDKRKCEYCDDRFLCYTELV